MLWPTAQRPREPMWPIVEESFDEAEFLWRAWEESLHSPVRNYGEVWTWHEERLASALEGVRVARRRACEELLLPGLVDHTEPTRFVVCTHLLATMAWEQMCPLLFHVKAETLALIRRSLEVLTQPTQVVYLEARLHDLRELGLPWLVAMRNFRNEPCTAGQLHALLDSPIPEFRSWAMHGARLLPTYLAQPIVALGLEDSNKDVVLAALESGLIGRMDGVWRRCNELSASMPEVHPWLAALAPENYCPILAKALSDAGQSHCALRALGFIGTKEAANAALAQMQVPQLARLACEAFCTITGLNLAAHDLVDKESGAPDEAIAFEDDDLHADLVPTLDERLPLPHINGVQDWWLHHAKHFDEGQRYIGGRPHSLWALQEALVVDPMRRRHLRAFELAVRTRGACFVQTRGFHALQHQHVLAVADYLAK